MWDLLIGLAPLFALAVFAVVIVWRGLSTKSDDTDNRAKGGGAKWDHWRD